MLLLATADAGLHLWDVRSGDTQEWRLLTSGAAVAARPRTARRVTNPSHTSLRSERLEDRWREERAFVCVFVCLCIVQLCEVCMHGL